ncbi:hypothetical protein U1839_13605 [Sphingomonas sp. RT2P30]|uniref:hypothetical protein n=1 Tax=Parasphingomonas halimpatiens TaxID=3096162 RepID=UPI002FC9D48C
MVPPMSHNGVDPRRPCGVNLHRPCPAAAEQVSQLCCGSRGRKVHSGIDNALAAFDGLIKGTNPDARWPGWADGGEERAMYDLLVRMRVVDGSAFVAGPSCALHLA